MLKLTEIVVFTSLSNTRTAPLESALMNTISSIKLPRLIGARSSAIVITESLSSDCTDVDVVLDASELVSAAQGFTDELINQILIVRNARSLTVENSTKVLKRHLSTSANLRDVFEKLVVNER